MLLIVTWKQGGYNLTSKKNKQENFREMIGRIFDHAQLRAMERYGLMFTHDIQNTIREDIKNKVFNILLQVPESTRMVVRGRVQGQPVTMVYCERLEVVITFLHNNWVSTDTDEFYILMKDRRKPNNPSATKENINKGKGIRLATRPIRKMKTPRHLSSIKVHMADGWED
jgi:hypothetical protein